MVNKIFLVGRCGKNVELRHLGDGTSVASFTLATNETFKDKSGQKVEEVTWHNIVLWRHVAEIAEKYVKKGDLLYLEGKIKNRSWEDKDGQKHYITEIVCDTLKMLGGKKEETTQAPEAPESPEQENDGLPF